ILPARIWFRTAKIPSHRNLGDWAHGPFGRTLDDGADKDVAMVRTRKSGGRVQMYGAPVPALRHDPGRASAECRLADAVQQQYAEFGGDARPGLVLKNTRPDDALQECARGRQTRGALRRERHLPHPFQNGFPSLDHTEI